MDGGLHRIDGEVEHHHTVAAEAIFQISRVGARRAGLWEERVGRAGRGADHLGKCCRAWGVDGKVQRSRVGAPVLLEVEGVGTRLAEGLVKKLIALRAADGRGLLHILRGGFDADPHAVHRYISTERGAQGVELVAQRLHGQHPIGSGKIGSGEVVVGQPAHRVHAFRKPRQVWLGQDALNHPIGIGHHIPIAVICWRWGKNRGHIGGWQREHGLLASRAHHHIGLVQVTRFGQAVEAVDTGGITEDQLERYQVAHIGPKAVEHVERPGSVHRPGQVLQAPLKGIVAPCKKVVGAPHLHIGPLFGEAGVWRHIGITTREEGDIPAGALGTQVKTIGVFEGGAYQHHALAGGRGEGYPQIAERSVVKMHPYPTEPLPILPHGLVGRVLYLCIKIGVGQVGQKLRTVNAVAIFYLGTGGFRKQQAQQQEGCHQIPTAVFKGYGNGWHPDHTFGKGYERLYLCAKALSKCKAYFDCMRIGLL